MKGFTVGRHAGLDGCGGRDAVAPRRSGRRGSRRRATNNVDTHVVAQIKCGAGAADGGVPVIEVGERDAEFRCDSGALITTLDEVEGVTVGNHARLDRLRRRDAVARLGRRRGSEQSCAADDVDANVVSKV